MSEEKPGPLDHMRYIQQNIDTLSVKRTSRDSAEVSMQNAWKQTLKDLIGPRIEKAIAQIEAHESRWQADRQALADLRTGLEEINETLRGRRTYDPEVIAGVVDRLRALLSPTAAAVPASPGSGSPAATNGDKEVEA